MKELRRLREQRKDAFEDRLLGSWREDGPGAARRERAWSALAGGLGLGAAATGVGAASSAATAAHLAPGVAGAKAATTASVAPAAAAAVSAKGATSIAAATLKWIVTGAIASAAVGGAIAGVLQLQPRAVVPHSRPAAPVSVERAAQVEPRAVESPGSPLSTDQAPVPAEGTASPPAAPPMAKRPSAPAGASTGPRFGTPSSPYTGAARSSTAAMDEHLIGEQVASLDQARGALTAGDPALAIRLLDGFDARYPSGALSQEATVMRVKALLAAKRTEDAMIVARRFLNDHAQTPYAAQVRQLIGEEHQN